MADQILMGVIHPPRWMGLYVAHAMRTRIRQDQHSLAHVIRQHIGLPVHALEPMDPERYRSRIALSVVPPDGGLLDSFTEATLLRSIREHARRDLAHHVLTEVKNRRSERYARKKWFEERGILPEDMASDEMPLPLAVGRSAPPPAAHLVAVLFPRPYVTKWLYSALNSSNPLLHPAIRQIGSGLFSELALRVTMPEWEQDTPMEFHLDLPSGGNIPLPVHNRVCAMLEREFWTYVRVQADRQHYQLGITKRNTLITLREMLSITEEDLGLDSMVRIYRRLESGQERHLRRGRPLRSSSALSLHVSAS